MTETKEARYAPDDQAAVLSLTGISDSLATSLTGAYREGLKYAGSVLLDPSSLSAIREDVRGTQAVLSWPYYVSPADLAVVFDEDPTHRACCMVKTSSVIANGCRLAHETRRAQEPSNAMVDEFELLFGPNGIDEFITFTETDFGALGNAFVEVTRNSRGRVHQLVHVPAYTMYRLAPPAKGKLPYGDFVQIVGGQSVYFREFGSDVRDYQSSDDRWPNEMVHLREYTPSNAWYGLPRIWSALFAALSNRLQHLNVIEFFEDKGISRYLLVMDGAYNTIDPKNQKTLTNYINSLMEVRSNKLILMGTPQDTKSTLEELRTDVAFKEYNVVRDANRDEICRVHGVPPRLVSIVTAGSLGGSAEGESEFNLFKSLVVRPRQRAYERLFQKVFFSQYDKRRSAWSVQFNEIDFTDFQKKAQALNVLVRGGLLTINEARSELGRTSIGEIGDKPFVSAGGVPMPVEMIGEIDTLGEIAQVRGRTPENRTQSGNDRIQSRGDG